MAAVKTGTSGEEFDESQADRKKSRELDGRDQADLYPLPRHLCDAKGPRQLVGASASADHLLQSHESLADGTRLLLCAV